MAEGGRSRGASEQGRYLIGIDLGTTNSAVAYVDMDVSKNPSLRVQSLRIPQSSARGLAESLPLLPSFYYCDADGRSLVGELAKTLGEKIPGRLVASAKSWLAHPAALRREKILPVEADAPALRVSPVEVTAAYLRHLREGWDLSMARGDISREFTSQEVVITIPASFDEAARMLTVEAAREAGYENFTLIEEPLAAFYSWLQGHKAPVLPAGKVVLVCDVGGGTTDFSLIATEEKEGVLAFERTAVGSHLLLGGDNMDACLVELIERRAEESGRGEVPRGLRCGLVAEARRAKEFLLSQGAGVYQVTLQGTGSQVVGGSWSLELSYHDVFSALMEGFFAVVPWEEAKILKRSLGLRTMGLPYAAEPSILKNLADFLARQNGGMMPCIDYVLFNGGVMTPAPFQQAVVEALSLWGGRRPEVLESKNLDTAVAQGAACYGKVRRGVGLRVHSGMPRTYYLAIDTEEGKRRVMTCVPKGADETFSYEAEHPLCLMSGAPVAFTLFSSQVRRGDVVGEILDLDMETMTPLFPLQTVIRKGKSQHAEKVPVRLCAMVTSYGCLELVLKAIKTPHVWKLQMDLATEKKEEHLSCAAKVSFDETMLSAASLLITECFSGAPTAPPGALVRAMEEALQADKEQWSTALLRGLWPALACAKRAGKRLTAEHAARWWHLAGYLLRPGFGHPLDTHHVKELWQQLLADDKKDKGDTALQRVIAYRRIAGGLSKGQQQQLAGELIAALFDKKMSSWKVSFAKLSQGEREALRALASFERLEMSMKVALGDRLVDAITRGPCDDTIFWALGRLASRRLLYGTLAQALPSATVTLWIERIVEAIEEPTPPLAAAVAQMAKVTGHREVDLPKNTRKSVNMWLGAWQEIKSGGDEDMVQPHDASLLFGEHLPSGLVLQVC